MKIFLDYTDKRTKFLSNKFNKNTFEITKENLKQASKNDVIVFPPNKKWTEEEIKLLPNNTMLFCGKVDNSILGILKEKNIKYINFLDDEIFAIENANLTAEGVLSIIIENSPRSIFENSVLLLGCGRISKALAILFAKLGIKFSIASFSEKSFFESHYYSPKNYYSYTFLEDIKNFDVIVNTRPYEFLDEKQIKKIANGTLFIETASKNCLDEEKAKHFSYIKAPALPQRFCFESASNLLLKKILGEIQ